jgi:hypothetical protein
MFFQLDSIFLNIVRVFGLLKCLIGISRVFLRYFWYENLGFLNGNAQPQFFSRLASSWTLKMQIAHRLYQLFFKNNGVDDMSSVSSTKGKK